VWFGAGLTGYEGAMPFDMWFLLVGLFAVILLVGLLVMLGRGGVRKGPPPESKGSKRSPR
jgi:hypothetical protein